MTALSYALLKASEPFGSFFNANLIDLVVGLYLKDSRWRFAKRNLRCVNLSDSSSEGTTTYIPFTDSRIAVLISACSAISSWTNLRSKDMLPSTYLSTSLSLARISIIVCISNRSNISTIWGLEVAKIETPHSSRSLKSWAKRPALEESEHSSSASTTKHTFEKLPTTSFSAVTISSVVGK